MFFRIIVQRSPLSSRRKWYREADNKDDAAGRARGFMDGLGWKEGKIHSVEQCSEAEFRRATERR